MPSCESFYRYLPVDDLVMRWGSHPTGAGRGVIPPGQPYPTREHPSLNNFDWQHGRTLPEFAIILITGGRGVFESRQTSQASFESDRFPLFFLIRRLLSRGPSSAQFATTCLLPKEISLFRGVA